MVSIERETRNIKDIPLEELDNILCHNYDRQEYETGTLLEKNL